MLRMNTGTMHAVHVGLRSIRRKSSCSILRLLIRWRPRTLVPFWSSEKKGRAVRAHKEHPGKFSAMCGKRGQ